MSIASVATKKCPTCTIVASDRTQKGNECEFCTLWAKQGLSRGDIAATMHLFWQYWPLVLDGTEDVLKFAGTIQGKASRADQTVGEFLRTELRRFPKCCRCDMHIAVKQQFPVCKSHEPWWKQFEARVRDRFSGEQEFVRFGRETAAPLWIRTVGENGEMDTDEDTWQLFLQEIAENLPRSAHRAPPASRFGTTSSATPSPKPAPPPPKPAPAPPTPPVHKASAPPPSPPQAPEPAVLKAPAVQASALPAPITDAFDGAERVWITKNRIQDEYGFTREELNIVVAALRAYKKAHPDYPVKGMYSAAALFRKDVLPDLAKRIIAARGKEAAVQAPAPAAPSASPPAPTAASAGSDVKQHMFIHGRLEGFRIRIHGLIAEAHRLIREVDEFEKEIS